MKQEIRHLLSLLEFHHRQLKQPKPLSPSASIRTYCSFHSLKSRTFKVVAGEITLAQNPRLGRSLVTHFEGDSVARIVTYDEDTLVLYNGVPWMHVPGLDDLKVRAYTEVKRYAWLPQYTPPQYVALESVEHMLISQE